MKSTLAILITLLTAAICSADPITFIHQGRRDGSIGGTSFGPFTEFIFTAVGDTANRVLVGSNYRIPHDSAKIELVGIGTFDLVSSPTLTYLSQSAQSVGFSRLSGTTLFDIWDIPELGTWDMLTSIGPVTGFGELTQWDSFTSINTTGGVLEFSEGLSPSTFTAIVTPEPSSLCLCIGSIVLLGIRRRC